METCAPKSYCGAADTHCYGALERCDTLTMTTCYTAAVSHFTNSLFPLPPKVTAREASNLAEHFSSLYKPRN